MMFQFEKFSMLDLNRSRLQSKSLLLLFLFSFPLVECIKATLIQFLSRTVINPPLINFNFNLVLVWINSHKSTFLNFNFNLNLVLVWITRCKRWRLLDDEWWRTKTFQELVGTSRVHKPIVATMLTWHKTKHTVQMNNT